MRVLCRDMKCAVEVDYVKCDGNRLVFVTSASVGYQTDEYYHENIAYGKMSDLVIHGYIVVDKLCLKEYF